MSRKEVMFVLVVVILATSLVSGVVYADPGITVLPQADDPVFFGITVEELAFYGQMDPTMFAQAITGEIPFFAVCVNSATPVRTNDTIPDYLKGLPDGTMDPTLFAQVITGEIPPLSTY